MLIFQDGVLSFTECSSAIRTLGLRQSGRAGLVDYLPAILTVQTGLMKQKINSLSLSLSLSLTQSGPDYANLSPGKMEIFSSRSVLCKLSCLQSEFLQMLYAILLKMQFLSGGF